MTIRKGDRVGVIGATGSGKSTLIDILMGLLKPTSGTLKVDGKVITKRNVRGWQRHIAHVPQAIFLSDTTIAENIAFGINRKDIDFDRVTDAANKAQLQDFIDKLPNKFNTIVGERGVRFSGGQRQRIGIARALYNNPRVLVLDEATSALDTETENGVMESVRNLQGERTVIIVAHRLTTVSHCTRIFTIEDAQLVDTRAHTA